MPPRPLFQGSTAASAKQAATAASAALPPASMIATPASAASRFCETTMPCLPAATGLAIDQFCER